MGKLIITGTGNIGEVTDELPIEVHKAKEGLDLLYLCQGRPFHDSTDLHWIHGNVVFEMTNPRYSTSFHLNLHFSGLRNSLYSQRVARTCVTLISPRYGKSQLGPADFRSATRLPSQPLGPPGSLLVIWG